MDGSSLLARQQALVRYLSDPQAFAEAGADLPIEGVDRAGLRLVGELSLGKRMEKIRSLLPRTFLQIGHDRLADLGRDFAAACRPTSAVRYDNARQFHDYLTGRWRDTPPDPPYLPDLAVYEMAEARLRRQSDAMEESPEAPVGIATFRRDPRVALLRLDFDIRALMETTIGDPFDPPSPDPVHLVFVPTDGGRKPKTYNFLPDAFEVLQEIEDWRERDLDNEEMENNLRMLAGRGIVEIAP